MAKSKAQPARAEAARRSRTAKADAERWGRVLLIGGVLAAIIFAGVIIIVGYYLTHIRPLGKTVLQVGNASYSLGALESRMRLLRQQDPTYGTQATASALRVLPDVTLNLLEREAKLLEAASQLKVTVTDQEVVAEIRSRGSLAADVESSAYAAEFRKQVDNSGLSENEYLRMIRANLLGQKVLDYYRFFAPASEPQVRGQYIVFDDSTKASQALQRLKAGDAVDKVAADLGISSTSSGGQALNQVAWTPRTDTTSNPERIQDYLFLAQPGQLSDVINIGSYFIVVQLLERDGNRALDDQGKQQVAGREEQKWLDGLDAKLVVKRNLSTGDAVRALNDM